MNILALSAHTDDAELGAGGFLARAVEDGDTVSSIAFSTGNPETGSNYGEFCEANKALGIIYSECYNFKTRHFLGVRQDILDQLIHLLAKRKPDLVLIPSTKDVHQDHQVVASEAMRAFRTCSILGYELPWCNYSFQSTMYVPLTEGQMAKKQQALACYKSQQERHYFDEYAVNLARVRGMQIGVEYAEAFEAIRWVMR